MSFVAVMVIACPTYGDGFAAGSHSRINEVAVQSSQAFTNYLQDILGFGSGFRAHAKNAEGVEQKIIDWIKFGGEAEDRLWFNNGFGEWLGAIGRSGKHFHQPLRLWPQAGFFRWYDSSIYWAQDRNQAPGRKASWFDARSTFLSALTASTDRERNANLAETFQTLGQLMHLVADSASVPHARDESHVFGYNFEKFVARLSIPSVIPTGFDPTILQQPTGDDRAPVPIAFLWDTDTYNGTNPPGTGDSRIGIAEFTNSNFFSASTISEKAFQDPELPLPAIDRLTAEVTAPDLRTGEPARYLSKLNDGVQVEHMVRVYSISGYSPTVVYGLDDRVYGDYAAHLVPRAIGYSAGILDYFFRGKIRIEAPDRFAYALAHYQEGNSGSFTKMRFKVSNDTDYPNTTEDTDGPGLMRAVVRYRKPTDGKNLIENPYATLSEPYYATSAPLMFELTRAPQEVSFDFSGQNAIPTNAADIFLWVVWVGKLGQERGAIMVGGKDLLEPDPLTFGNGTDYDCFQQTLYHVADLLRFPPYSPPLQTQRDVNNDGVQDIFGAFTDYGEFIKSYDPAAPKIASPDLYDFRVSQQQAEATGPQYSRFMLLQDRAVYGFSWRVTSSVEVPTGATNNIPRNFQFYAAGNQNDLVSDETGRIVRRVTPGFIYRGVPTLSMYIMTVEGPPRFQPCLAGSYSVPEQFCRIDGLLAPEE